ncbi:MAG TPA: aminotransferase V, partial [Thermodesulfobacteriota bacterium]|nr:aminotransferase V [Thermodesulfobacteriota bacterium]
FVFHDRDIRSRPDSLPRYIDIGLYAESEGTPFTLSSNLLFALGASLDNIRPAERYLRIRALSGHLRERLSGAGFEILAGAGHESPAIITIPLPERLESGALGMRLERSGFFLNWRSSYLRDRNWIQIALMGDCTESELDALVGLLSGEAQFRRRA